MIDRASISILLFLIFNSFFSSFFSAFCTAHSQYCVGFIWIFDAIHLQSFTMHTHMLKCDWNDNLYIYSNLNYMRNVKRYKPNRPKRFSSQIETASILRERERLARRVKGNVKISLAHNSSNIIPYIRGKWNRDGTHSMIKNVHAVNCLPILDGSSANQPRSMHWTCSIRSNFKGERARKMGLHDDVWNILSKYV